MQSPKIWRRTAAATSESLGDYLEVPPRKGPCRVQRRLDVRMETAAPCPPRQMDEFSKRRDVYSVFKKLLYRICSM
ncbi:hypothetical protein GEV33_000464 [Tenebrio molitor]|uniref:Uncharacterized protein n=1 Tax=Tenebrio molitor TaxID=7067 RepID=A0A8J6HY17_TENMO|nr:hypothetical protein GEV33_000464 [Tenebrio molitor]